MKPEDRRPRRPDNKHRNDQGQELLWKPTGRENEYVLEALPDINPATEQVPEQPPVSPLGRRDALKIGGALAAITVGSLIKDSLTDKKSKTEQQSQEAVDDKKPRPADQHRKNLRESLGDRPEGKSR